MKVLPIAIIVGLLFTSCWGNSFPHPLTQSPANSDFINYAEVIQEGKASELQANVKTFLNLANQYLPVLEETKERFSLTNWEWIYSVNLGVLTFTIRWEFTLDIGWTVDPGDIEDDGGWTVTYMPFVIGETYLWNDFDFSLWQVNVDPHFQYLYTYMPIDIALHGDGRVCFTAVYKLASAVLYSYVSSRLQE